MQVRSLLYCPQTEVPKTVIMLRICCRLIFSWFEVVFVLLWGTSTFPLFKCLSWHLCCFNVIFIYFFIHQVYFYTEPIAYAINIKWTHLSAFFPSTQMVTNRIVPPKQIKDESKCTDGG